MGAPASPLYLTASAFILSDHDPQATPWFASVFGFLLDMESFMRVFASITAVLVLAVSSGTAQAPLQSPATSYLCPQCGKLHVHATGSSVQAVPQITPQSPSGTTSGVIANYKPAVNTARTAVQSAPPGGVTNALSMLNAQRGRQGISSLRYDPQLQAVAQRRVQQMAATGLKDHPPGSIAPGTHEGVGWSSSFSPSGVSACYTSDTRMHYAGAAMATGRDGVYFAVVYR